MRDPRAKIEWLAIVPQMVSPDWDELTGLVQYARKTLLSWVNLLHSHP